MKVALVRNHDVCINTRQIRQLQKRAGVLPHLGLGYIETALRRHGHDVETIDAQAENLDRDALRLRLAKFGPGLVGVTTTTPGFPGALEACEIAKELGAFVILGGPHTEVFIKENLCHRSIDVIGVGEGATIMPELADKIEDGLPLKDVRGLVGRDFFNSPAPMKNLEAMGWPTRNAERIHQYHSIVAKKPFATMISSRGCPFQCSFCFKQAVDRKSMFRSANDVVDEMEYLVKEFGVREIMFYDDVFTMKRKRVLEICDQIEERQLKVRWEAPTRVDLVDKSILQKMASSGCIRLRFGIESGDYDILVNMKKATNLEKIRESVRLAKEAGIETFAYFIVGWLGETQEQFERTVELSRNLPLDYASFYTATPLPGTKLFEESVAAGKVEPDYWTKYVEGATSKRISLLTADAETRSRLAYRRFYLRPSKAKILARHLVNPRTFSPVLSGLLSLFRSNANAVRDM